MTGRARAWHAALAAIAVAALIGQTVLVIDDGTSLVDLFSYFTIQSNLLVAGTSAVIASGRVPTGHGWRVIRLAALVGITVTGVVYATLIGPYVEFDGLALVLDTTFHYVVPVAAVLGHVVLGPRPAWQWADLAMLAWPVAWLTYTLLRAEIGSPAFATADDGTSRYPYDFIDVDAHGSGAVAVACVGVTVLLALVAAAYVRTARPASSP